jgi:hypothetical protein
VGPTQPPIQCLPEEFCPEVERPVSKAENLRPSCAEVKNAGVIPPLLTHVFLAWYLVKHKGNITLNSIILSIFLKMKVIASYFCQQS